MPAIHQRHFDVLQHRELLNQVVRLKDEADPRRTDLAKLVVVHLRDVVIAQEVVARGRPVEAAEQVQQRALAGAGGTHDRHVVAGGDLERDAANGMHRLGAHHVVFLEISTRTAACMAATR